MLTVGNKCGQLCPVKAEMLKLEWDQMNVQSRQYLCEAAGISVKLARKTWWQLEKWLQTLLREQLENRSKKKVTL